MLKNLDNPFLMFYNEGKESVMKFIKRLLCGFLAGVSLFACGCISPSAERNLNVECAPCTVKEIWNWNEEVYKEFYYIRNSIAQSALNAVKCTVNGEEWSVAKQVTEDLPVGEYQIRFYTEEGFTIPVNRVGEDGQFVREEIPYEKELTLSVTVSKSFGDIYDIEYRLANGIWVDPSQQKWYQDLIKEINKK